MFPAYPLICGVIILVMLGLEFILRYGEIRDGERFTFTDVCRRRLVAVALGIVLFFALWAYIALSGENPVSFLEF